MTDAHDAPEMKPCPFCGGEAEIRSRVDENIWDHSAVEWLSVSCGECEAGGFDWPAHHEEVDGEPFAITQWQARADLAPQWREISSAPDHRKWEVSSEGHVRVDGNIKSQHTSDKGYRKVCLGPKTVFVHRLVAEAFLEPEDGMGEVNHLDGNKVNNAATNLAWCNRSENMSHAYACGLHGGVSLSGKDSPHWSRRGRKHAQSVPVRAVFEDGSFRDYESQGMAADDGFSPTKISDCINGRRKRHAGATWMPLPQPPEDGQ